MSLFLPWTPHTYLSTSSPPTVKGVFEPRAFRPFIFCKERGRAVSIWLQSQRGKANNLEGSGTEGLGGKMQGCL